jgi:hypothetical protein
MGWQPGLVGLAVACADWDALHSSLGDFDCVTHCESASEVGVLEELLGVVVVPMEVGLNHEGHLEVPGHTISVDRNVFWVIDVVHLELVVRELTAINSNIHSHAIVAN